MADGVIAERNVVAVGDERLVALAYCQRDEVISFAFESGRDAGRNGSDHAFEVERVDCDFTGTGVTDTVRGLRYRSLPNHIGGITRDRWSGLGHASCHSTHQRQSGIRSVLR